MWRPNPMLGILAPILLPTIFSLEKMLQFAIVPDVYWDNLALTRELLRGVGHLECLGSRGEIHCVTEKSKFFLVCKGSSGPDRSRVGEIARRGAILAKVHWGHARICDKPRGEFTRGCFASHYQTLRPISSREEEVAKRNLALAMSKEEAQGKGLTRKRKCSKLPSPVEVFPENPKKKGKAISAVESKNVTK